MGAEIRERAGMMEDAKLYIEPDPDEWKFAAFVVITLTVAGLGECICEEGFGMNLSCPAHASEDKITKADIQTTGEKIPYFGHVRRKS